MTDPKQDGQKGEVTPRRDHLWAWIIGVALAVVMAVNAAFIYIAVSGADDVAPSYNSGER